MNESNACAHYNKIIHSRAANAKPILVQNLIHRIKCVKAQGKSPDLFLFCGYAMQNKTLIHLHT